MSVSGRTLTLRYRGHSGQAVRELNVMFTKKKAGDAIAAIDKFLEWERLATERGDTLVKAIAARGSFYEKVLGPGAIGYRDPLTDDRFERWIERNAELVERGEVGW